MDNEENNLSNGFSHLGLYGFFTEKAQKVIEKRLEAIREMKKDDQAQNSSDLEREYQKKSLSNPFTILKILCLDDKRISDKAEVN